MRIFKYENIYKNTGFGPDGSPIKYTGTGSCFSLAKQCSYFKYYFDNSHVHCIRDSISNTSLTVQESIEYVKRVTEEFIQELGLPVTFEPTINSFSFYSLDKDMYFLSIYGPLILSRYFISGDPVYHDQINAIYHLNTYENLTIGQALIVSCFYTGYYYYSLCNRAYLDVDIYNRMSDKSILFKIRMNGVGGLNQSMKLLLAGVELPSMNIDNKFPIKDLLAKYTEFKEDQQKSRSVFYKIDKEAINKIDAKTAITKIGSSTFIMLSENDFIDDLPLDHTSQSILYQSIKNIENTIIPSIIIRDIKSYNSWSIPLSLIKDKIISISTIEEYLDTKKDIIKENSLKTKKGGLKKSTSIKKIRSIIESHGYSLEEELLKLQSNDIN